MEWIHQFNHLSIERYIGFVYYYEWGFYEHLCKNKKQTKKFIIQIHLNLSINPVWGMFDYSNTINIFFTHLVIFFGGMGFELRASRLLEHSGALSLELRHLVILNNSPLIFNL
jgi:hypothetical protein